MPDKAASQRHLTVGLLSEIARLTHRKDMATVNNFARNTTDIT